MRASGLDYGGALVQQPPPSAGPGAPEAPAAAEVVPGLILSPVGGTNVFEETLERLLQLVKLGFVAPGARLPSERELAARLGVSRQTVREAVRSLIQAGYLEARRGRSGGTFVLDWPTRQSNADVRRLALEMGAGLLDALDLRRVIEPGAAELAAIRSTRDDHWRLRAAMAQIDAAPRVTFPAAAREEPGPAAFAPIDAPSPPDATAPALSYRAADIRLHLVIAELSGSASIVAAVTEVQLRLSDLLSATPQVIEVLRHSDEQHEDIVRAIERGRPTAARRTMQEHVESTATYLRAFLA